MAPDNDSLARIESKIDRMADQISDIQQHQAADLQRLSHLSEKCDAFSQKIETAVLLHAAACPVVKRVDVLETDKAVHTGVKKWAVTALVVIGGLLSWLVEQGIQAVMAYWTKHSN